MGVDMWADLSVSFDFFTVIYRWAGLAHRRQIYCFSSFLVVLSMFMVYSLNKSV